LGILAAGALGPLHAVPFPQSPDRPPATAQEKSDLRAAVEARYEVLPISGGVLLKPRQAKAGVRTVEVAGDRIAVNGEPVMSDRTLRDWLGSDADVVLRLQAVPAAGRRQLLGLGAEPAGHAQPAVKEAPPAATSDPDTEAAESSDAADAADAAETSDTTAEPSMAEPPAPPEPAAPAEDTFANRHSSGGRVNVGGGVHVAKDELADQVMAVGGAADVQGDVKHEVTAVGGPARIEGKVGGDVVSIGSNVYLGPHSVVMGDVTSIGGRIERDPGSVVHGGTNEVSMSPFGRHRHFHFGPTWGFWGGVSDLMGSLVRLVLTGLLVCLVLMVARRPLERVDRMLVTQTWPSVAAGLAGSIFFWPLLLVVTILLAITIVGCVLFLLYPFLLLYVGLLLILGYATVSYRLGTFLVGRLGLKIAGDYAAALTGLVALQGWIVLGNLFDLLPWPFGFFAFICWLFGTLATIAALVTGFGAVILSRFGLAPGYWPGRGAPVPAYPGPVVPPPPAYAPPPYSVPPAEGLPLSDTAGHPPEEQG
jgi:hypothetical protein